MAVLTILLPLAAVAVAGASFFLWQRTRLQDDRNLASPRMERRIEAVPENFSEGLDSALVSLLSGYGIGRADIKRRTGKSGIGNTFRVNVPSATSLFLLHLAVKDMADARGGVVMRGVESADGRVLTLILGARARPTDTVVLKKVPGLESKQSVAAIVIDDMGIRDSGDVRRLCDLGHPITLSILPFREFTADVVKLASETETPYILHMPMEPKPATGYPGEGAIMTGDPDAVIRQKLDRAFCEVKGSEGMNNHMGSRATEARRVMETVTSYLRNNGYFVIDSRTSNLSVLFKVAQNNGVKCAVISGYIDSEDDRNAIRTRLRELADEAIAHGPVIIVGHDRTATVDVLETEIPRIKARGIRLVPVSELVR